MIHKKTSHIIISALLPVFLSYSNGDHTFGYISHHIAILTYQLTSIL